MRVTSVLFFVVVFSVKMSFANNEATNSAKSTTTKIISTYHLEPRQLDDIVIAGVSGLAWDEDENRLYAVSDIGYVYHFKVAIKENNIDDVTLTAAYPLLDGAGRPLRRKFNDAEGLDVVNAHNRITGDTELIVAYERRPRVLKHLPDGTFLSEIPIGKTLMSKKNYRKPNKSLETVLHHSTLGLLLGSEVAMSGQNTMQHNVFSHNGDKSWAFSVAVANASFTGMAEMGNGDLLVLERTFDDIVKPFRIFLRQLKITDCGARSICETKFLAVLKSQQEHNLDNFEGLAKIDDHRYLMISDDNENDTQRTLLSLIVIE